MRLAPAVANAAWLASNLPAWHRYRRALERPAETQRAILRALLAENAHCAYGRSFRFAELRTPEEFRERMPVIDYDDLKPWIERIQRGEQGVLTSERVTRLVPTGGSTGGRKLIPFTVGLQREFNRAIGPWIVDLARRHPRVPLGPAYWSITPAASLGEEAPGAVPIGFDDDSAYLGGVRQWLVQAAMVAPQALRLVSSMEDFRYLTLLALLRQPGLSLISVWHPSFLTLLLEALPGWKEKLVHDVETGDAPQPAFRAKPQPRSARSLRELDFREPRALWPNLRVISCWGDGQAALACAHLRSRWPGVAIQPKGLLATEAFVSIPFAGLHPLALTSHIFEFEDGAGRCHLAHEIVTGQVYRVIVTTGGGLWRYRLGDLVEVDGHVGATPSIRFLGRGSLVSDLCGEKLSEAFVSRCVQALALVTPFAMVAPESPPDGAPHYTLFVEGTTPTELARVLEEQLCQNPGYRYARDLGQLGPLEIVAVPPGAYERFAAVLIAAGQKLGDIKPQSLSPRRDWRRHLDVRGEPNPMAQPPRSSDDAPPPPKPAPAAGR